MSPEEPKNIAAIYVNDMAGADWYRNMGQVLERHPQVLKIICGHGHLDLQGRLGHAHHGRRTDGV